MKMSELSTVIKSVGEMADRQNTSTSNIPSLVMPGGTFGRGVETLFNDRAQRQLLIATDPSICQGEPVIRGTRISVANIVELCHLLGWTIRQIREEYPHLTYQQILATLEYYEEHTREIDKYLQQEKETDEE